MNFLNQIKARLAALFRKRELDAEMDEELRSHIELRTQVNIEAGMNPEEARFAALRQFGWTESIKETCRDQRGVRWLENLVQDIRYGTRQLRKNPGFTAVAVLTLAVGIGLNTTVFSVGNAMLLKPLGASRSGDLVRIGRSHGQDQQFRSASYEEFKYLREHASSLSDLMGHQVESVVLSGTDGSAIVSAEIVAGDYFSMLGARPVVGRGFTLEEDRAPGQTAVVVISDRFWRQKCGADPATIGRTLLLNNQQFSIVGVAPPGFVGTFPGVDVHLWVPAMMTEVLMPRTDRRGPTSLMLVGRLKAEAPIRMAQAELQMLAQRMAEEDPDRDRERNFVVARARGLHPIFAHAARIIVLGLVTIVSVVLLMACANIAGMLLARASARGGELAVRLAVGASRRRVIAQLLTESFVLAMVGGICGLFLGLGAVRFLNGVSLTTGPTGAPVFLDLKLDQPVLLLTAMITMLTVVAFGLIPALQATRVDVMSVLRGSQSLFGGKRSRLLGGLVVMQVTLSFVLLVGAGLLFRSMRNATNVDVGFHPEHVVVASFDLQKLGYEGSRAERFYDELIRRVRTLPAVERAALAEFIPFMRGGTMEMTIPGRPVAEGEEQLSVPYNRISHDYFATVRQMFIQGRDFTERDRVGAAKVVIVNEAMARHFWPEDNPIGKRVSFGEGDEHEVIGIVKDARYLSLRDDVGPFVFLPVLQRSSHPTRLTLHIRTPAVPTDALADLGRLVREIDQNVAPHEARNMQEVIAHALLPLRLVKGVFAIAGVIALFLATGGLYGLVCYILQRRFREVGIRVALGATRLEIFRVIVGSTLRLTAFGVAIGITIAAAMTRVLASLLYGLDPTDPLTFAGIALLLAFVTLGAGYAAARKGLNVDPTVALRCE